MAILIIRDIYVEYSGDVYSYLLSLTGNKTLSEDLTSEVFLGAIKSLPSFKGEASIKTWLFSIARHKWYEHLRKNKKEPMAEEFIENYLYTGTSLEERAITKLQVEAIHKLLGGEPERSRQVVLMRIDGYPYFEIGQRLGISESSARVIDFRTKAKIRSLLIEEGWQ